MSKPLSIALLVGGIIVLTYGASASASIGPGLSQLFTGSPTDRTVWCLIGGAVATTAPRLTGVVRGSKS